MSINHRLSLLEQLRAADLDLGDLEVLVSHLQQRLRQARDEFLGGGKLVRVVPDADGWVVQRALRLPCPDGGTELDGPYTFHLGRSSDGQLRWRLLGRCDDLDF